MEDNFVNRGDLEINGASKASGGFYRNVVINGAAKVEGNIECLSFEISGASKFIGDVKSSRFQVNGATKINGTVEIENGEINGSCKIEGNLVGGNIVVNGATKIGGDAKGEEIRLAGAIKIGGDCEVDKFCGDGAFTIGGLLNSDDIKIGLGGRCEVSEIGGSNIEVRLSNKDIICRFFEFVRELFNQKKQLLSEVIEGDDISLEGTKARVVRGNKIVVGTDCIIDRVEFREELKVEGNGRVLERIKI